MVVRAVQRWLAKNFSTKPICHEIASAPVSAEKYNILLAAYVQLENQRDWNRLQFERAIKEVCEVKREVQKLNKVIQKQSARLKRGKVRIKELEGAWDVGLDFSTLEFEQEAQAARES